MAKYTPQGTSVTRVEKYLKDAISECDEDRTLVLEYLNELHGRLESNPEDHQTRVLISRALELLQSSKTYRLKALDTLTKIKLKELDIQSKDASNKNRENPKSFEDYQ